MILRLWDNTPYYNESFEQPEPYLTFYPAENNAKGASFIVCPGGGYQMRADHEGEPVALWLNSIGISAFVLAYRVAPYNVTAISQDVLRAVRVVRHSSQTLCIDPERIGVLGFSAGGHLASTAAVHFDDFAELSDDDPIDKASSRPNAAVLCYPVISANPKITHRGSFERLLNGAENPDALIAFFSNETQIKPNTPPVFLWHTSDDAAVDVENSLRFASGLRRQNIPFELHVYPSGVHGLGLASEHGRANGWTAACALWLAEINFR